MRFELLEREELKRLCAKSVIRMYDNLRKDSCK